MWLFENRLSAGLRRSLTAVRNYQYRHSPGADSLYEIQYDGSHGAPCECSPKMTHKSLQVLISETHD